MLSKLKKIILLKLNIPWAILILGMIGSLTGVYMYHNVVKTTAESMETKILKLKELIKYNHDLELERMKIDLYDPNSSPTNTLLNRIVETNIPDSSISNSFTSERVASTLADTTVVQKLSEYLSKILYYLNIQDFDLISVLQHIPLPITIIQYVTLGFILFNSIIFDSLMGLIVNHYIKLYGDHLLEKLPKWSLPIVGYYFKARQLSNYYLILMMIGCLLCSTGFCLYLYILEYLRIL